MRHPPCLPGITRLLLSCLLASAVLPGADDTISDLRLDVSPLLGRTFHEAGPTTDLDPANGLPTTTNTEFAFDQTVRSHVRWDLAYYYSLNDLEADRGSFLVGAAIALDRFVTQGHSSARSWVFDVFAGFAWAFTPSWHIEEGIILGAGRTRYKFHSDNWWDDQTAWDSESTAWCYEYGARIGSYYTLAEHVQLGLEVRYLVLQTTMHFDGAHMNQGGQEQENDWRPTLRIQGFGGSLSTGWRF